ncbi:MAG: helix-turn-helix transcriptional regulator [Betaproteobacteria bacterium]
MKNLVEIIDGDVIPLSEDKASRIPEYGTRYLVGDELFVLIQDYARRNANDVAWGQRVPQDVAERREARADARKLAEERASLVARVRAEGRPWRTMLGISEIAEEVGAKRQTVAQWYRRGKLPQPTEVLAAGPVWTREAIQPWLDEQILDLDAYFCEWEDEGYCITYPVRITTRHSASSYGQPVVVIDEEARGPAEMPAGELQLPAAVHARLAPRLRKLGYLVCANPVDEDWLDCWERGKEVEHWHPEARRVRF